VLNGSKFLWTVRWDRAGSTPFWSRHWKYRLPPAENPAKAKRQAGTLVIREKQGLLRMVLAIAHSLAFTRPEHLPYVLRRQLCQGNPAGKTTSAGPQPPLLSRSPRYKPLCLSCCPDSYRDCFSIFLFLCAFRSITYHPVGFSYPSPCMENLWATYGRGMGKRWTTPS
jgi:hypothetical protein